MTRLDTRPDATGTDAPPISHAYCACWNRDGITPTPSLCGQATFPGLPARIGWPEDRTPCAVCRDLESGPVRCVRCDGGGDDAACCGGPLEEDA